VKFVPIITMDIEFVHDCRICNGVQHYNSDTFVFHASPVIDGYCRL